MKIRGKRVLLCDCEGTMPLVADKLSEACRRAGAEGEAELNSQLCRAQIDNYRRALEGGEPLLVACTQEAPLFSEVAEEAGVPGEAGAEPVFVNIRETAGWSDAAAEADAKADVAAKIAALLAEAAVEIAPAPSVSMHSNGVCLVYGSDERALEAAKQLAGRLEVTLLLTQAAGGAAGGARDILPPPVMDVPIFQGRIVQAKGHLGAFAVTVNGYAAAMPSARGALGFEAPRDDAFSECDLILDLSGGAPLFPAHGRRDGYLRPDPDDPAAVQKALFEISDLVGEFGKPRYVRYDAGICAHSRSRKTGCTRCLDVCPTSAITPAGDAVEIDPYICGGCGACASVCPTGAASYQLPGGDSLYERLRSLLRAYREAGGRNPVLLIHDGAHGAGMISAMARRGRGLPGHVLPFAVNEVTQIGLQELALALAYGASQIAILVGPEKAGELDGLAAQIGLAEAVMEGLGYGAGRVHVLDQVDPDQVEAALHDLETRTPPAAGSFLPMGGTRDRSLLALRHLYEVAPSPVDVLPLPPGAPFGAVRVDTGGCTLCLACVGACPTGALIDDPERPWLGLHEDACVQCGLCRTTCPESVITLEPRLNFTDEARGAAVLNEAAPFECIRCGKPFGVRQSIERVIGLLEGKNTMFATSAQTELIRMCDDCRVVAQFDSPDAPMAGAARPATRTTDDYLREREIEEARAKLLEERAAQARADDGANNGANNGAGNGAAKDDDPGIA